MIPRPRQSRTVSRENEVIAAFGAVALVLAYAGLEPTSLDATVLAGVLPFVGVVVPTVVNESPDGRDEETDVA